MVFYHGKKKWNYSLEFSDMFKPPEEHYFKYIPKFEHILIEVPEVNKKKIKSTIVLEVFNLTLEHIFYPDRRDKIYKALELLFQGLQAEEAGEIFAVIVKYMLSATDLTPREVEEKVKHLPQGADTVRTTADVLRQEGKYEGVIIGEQQGLVKGKRESVIKAANSRLGILQPEIVNRIKTIQSLEVLDALFDYSLRAETMDQFTDQVRKITDN